MSLTRICPGASAANATVGSAGNVGENVRVDAQTDLTRMAGR